jgi:hypothetical protein
MGGNMFPTFKMRGKERFIAAGFFIAEEPGCNAEQKLISRLCATVLNTLHVNLETVQNIRR